MSGFLRLSFLAVLSALCSTWGAAAWSQAIDLGRGGSGTPIEITASNGIEWDRDAKRYVATGNAAARQGDTSVYGDRLVAWYREAATGGTEIFRYEAIGNVRFETPTQKVEGDRGIFDVDSEVVVVTGRALSTRQRDDRVGRTAHDGRRDDGALRATTAASANSGRTGTRAAECAQRPAPGHR